MGSNNLNSLSVARMYKLRPFGPIIPSIVYTCIHLYMDCTQYYIYTYSRIYMTLSPRQHRLEDALRHLLLEKPDEELSEDAIARLALSSEPDVLVDRAPSDRLQK